MTKVKIKTKTEKKPAVKKEKKLKKVENKTSSFKKEKYFESVGRRKTSVARVRIFHQKSKEFIVNGKILEEYFQIKELQKIALSPLILVDCLDKFKVSVRVKSGGIASQAEAVRHGISRALILFDPDLRAKLKKEDYFKRDPRMRERKKFGLKRARRAPQWSKR